MAQDLRGGMRDPRRIWWVVAACLASMGCEKIAEWTGTSPSASSASVTAPAAPLPSPAAGSALLSKPAVPPSEVVAVVNGIPISRREVEMAVQNLKAAIVARNETWEPLSAESVPDRRDLRDLVDELVTNELMAQDALARGVDRTTDVQRRFWTLSRSFLSQEWGRQQGAQISVSEEAITAFYNDPVNQWLFRRPERIRVRQMVVASEQEAKDALVKLLEGLAFEDVARQMAVPGRLEAATGSLVDQWVMHGAEKSVYAPDDLNVRTLPEDLEKAAFAIGKIGAVSSYVQGPEDGRFHLFQLAAREASSKQNLADLHDAIRNILTVRAFNEKIAELESKAADKIEKFPERLVGIEQ